MILVYNIFSVGLLGAKLSLLEVLATLAMLTWLFEELQKKYCMLKSLELNFLKGRQGEKGMFWRQHILCPGVLTFCMHA